jgi:hypothetical protein
MSKIIFEVTEDVTQEFCDAIISLLTKINNIKAGNDTARKTVRKTKKSEEPAIPIVPLPAVAPVPTPTSGPLPVPMSTSMPIAPPVEEITYEKLMNEAMRLISENKITHTKVLEIVKKNELQNLPEAQFHPDKIPVVLNSIYLTAGV